MKTLYEKEQADEIRSRLQNIHADSVRQWGKMTPAQAMAHCANAMESAVGDENPPRSLIGRFMGPIARAMILKDDKPFSRNSPTAPNLVISDEREFEKERQRLVTLVNRFVDGGRSKCTRNPHQFFGRLSPDQWGLLMYKHLDHHLRQFGA